MQKSFIFRTVEFSQKHAVSVILITAAISIFLGYFALQVEIDPDIADFLPEYAEPIKLIEKYGENVIPAYIIVAVESENLFTLGKLKAFAEAIRKIEALPEIKDSINPFNLITFQKKGKRLALIQMSPGRTAPETTEELERFKQRLTNDPLARNLVISNDLTALCSIFHTALLDDYSELLSSIENAFLDLKPHFKIYLTGQIPLIHMTNLYLLRDVPKLLILAIIIILLVFYISFKSRRAVILPFTVVGLGTLWTIGIMSLLDYKLTIATIMVPPLVLTLGSSYSIHILNQYYREAKVGATDKHWIAGSVSHINSTILMASITTIIGFGSLLSATLRQIREFGTATSVGIFICAFLSLLFFPAALFKLRAPTAIERDRVLKGYAAILMEKISRGVIKWRFLILAVLILITPAFFLSLKNVRYRTDYLSYFREKEKIVDDSLFVVEKFGGFSSLYVTLNAPSDEKNYFLDPKVLKNISLFEEKLKDDPDIAYISSFVSYLKLMNFKMNGNFDIPEKRVPILLLSRYFKSISSSPYGKAIAGTLINKDFTRLTIALRIYNSEENTPIYEVKLKDFINRIEQEIEKNLDPATSPVIWGSPLVTLYISETLTKDQISSVVVSIVLIFLFTALSFRSIKFGLFTLIPMLTGIMLNIIIMSFFDIPFDMVTIMFSSVAIGVGIDNSIHLIIQYRRQAVIFHDDKRKILSHTLKISGRPILLTSTSLIAGLLVLTFSSFMPIMYFGILVSIALFATTLGSLIILPAILYLQS